MTFVYGLLSGAATVLIGFVLLLFLPWAGLTVPATLPTAAALQPGWDWLRTNLGHSLWVFALVLFLYLRALLRLHRLLANEAAVEEVAQAEQLVDVWTSLFFGAGVIWTAIGMRTALIQALGDGGVTAGDDAAELLGRLVDGGILLALSTTIFGGIGGYLMRVVKVVAIGARLRGYYGRLARASAEGVETVLVEIREGLEHLVPPTESNRIPEDDRIPPGTRADATRP